MQCPSCHELAPQGAKWCEACGSDLSASGGRICTACGAQEVSDDDYCMACGHKQPSERDHQFFTDADINAVSDRGKRHHHNEDAVAIGSLSNGGAVLVVCDGVSSTPGSDLVSLGAVIAARNSLVSGLNSADDAIQVAALLLTAASEAQTHAASTPPGRRRTKTDTAGPPSATFVAAIARPSSSGSIDLSVGWLGDSRAYWLDGDQSLLLTTDHAIKGSLSRWIGADAPDTEPETAQVSVPSGGQLVVCSDGLWRYAETPAEMAALVDGFNSKDPSNLAESLVQFANESGGHDNISVAVWPVKQKMETATI